jgi:hypothetical protein
MIQYTMQFFKNFKTIFLICFLTLLFPISIYAFSYYSTQNQEFDTTLTDTTSTIHVNPTKIYLTQVTTNSDTLLRDPAKWVKSIYYYSITRLHFSDLPYTYLLDENGIIYQGNTGGVGANPQLREVEGAVTIGYLSNNPVLTNRARESLIKMVDDISYKWGISELSTVRMYINQEEGKLSTISVAQTTGEFSNSISNSLQDWSGYDEENLEYILKIEELIYEKEIAIGERLPVTVKVRNMNDFIWFTDKDPIYISVKDGEESAYAINQEWLSFSKPTSISDVNVLPGESVEFEFALEARVVLGEAVEAFEILKFENRPFQNSEFEIKVEITRGEKRLVEVASPRYSFVNIRDCRWYSCEVVDSADNGTIFVLEEEEAGWSRIMYGLGLYGWVNSAYLKEI